MKTLTRTHTVIDSPIGWLTLVAEGDALTGLYMEKHCRRPAESSFGTRVEAGFEEPIRQLRDYFAGTRSTFDLPLAPYGDDFSRQVWDLLSQIPYGETRTYGQLARALGDPTLARAVGSANARNPISVIVPCHRVVGADGNLTGYAGGLDRKRFLLDLEAPPPDRSARLF